MVAPHNEEEKVVELYIIALTPVGEELATLIERKPWGFDYVGELNAFYKDYEFTVVEREE